MRLPQVIAVGVAVLLIVLLFIAPRTPSVNDVVTEKSGEFNSDSLILIAEKALTDEHRKEYELLKQDFMNKAAGAEEKMRKFWAEHNDPFGMAVYQQVVAERSGTFDQWLLSGKDYYRTALFVEPGRKVLAYSLAINSFSKALKIQPGNKEAKLKLAVCYVEQSRDPMKGVTMLRELVTEDSTNVDAQLQLGFFSMQSNQFDKAIDRFMRILQIDPGYSDAYLYIGQAYEMKGSREKAIKNYEKYYETVSDSLVRAEVKKHIDKLRTN